MGIFSFIKDAGAKIFGANEADAAADKVTAIDAKLAEYNVRGVRVAVEEDVVILTGRVSDIKDKKKAIIIAGNIDGISSVDDKIRYYKAAPDVVVADDEEGEEVELDAAKAFYTVKSGDSLSKISGEVYGDVMKYEQIFEANKPMLTDMDKIYPGQVLIIPELEA